MKLVEKYRIDKKISKLEKLYLERTIGRGDNHSKAYIIWKHAWLNREMYHAKIIR